MTAVPVALGVGETEGDLDRQARALPRAVSAGEAADPRVAHVLQGPAGEKAAGAAGAVEDYLGVAIGDRLLDAKLEESARDLARPGQDPRVRLVLLTDVDEDGLARLELAGEVCGCDFTHAGARGLEELGLGNGVGHDRPRTSLDNPGAAWIRVAARHSRACTPTYDPGPSPSASPDPYVDSMRSSLWLVLDLDANKRGSMEQQLIALARGLRDRHIPVVMYFAATPAAFPGDDLRKLFVEVRDLPFDHPAFAARRLLSDGLAERPGLV